LNYTLKYIAEKTSIISGFQLALWILVNLISKVFSDKKIMKFLFEKNKRYEFQIGFNLVFN